VSHDDHIPVHGDPAEHEGGLPLLNARTWSLGFLVIAVVLAVIYGLTMPGFFEDAMRAAGK
jgi:hypothetical protein